MRILPLALWCTWFWTAALPTVQAAPPQPTPTPKAAQSQNKVPAKPTASPARKGPSRIAVKPSAKAMQRVQLGSAIKTAQTSPFGFRLTRTDARKLALQFYSTDPAWDFDPTAPLTIQLNAPATVTIKPSVITGSEWPPRARAMNLAYTQKATPKPIDIEGAGSFKVCQKKTRNCRRVSSKFSLLLPRT